MAATPLKLRAVAPADLARAKAVGGPITRPGVARRYPRLFRGDQIAAAVLTDILHRRGVPLVQVAEDLEVHHDLVRLWCANERAAPFGLAFALQNERLAESILEGAIEWLRARGRHR